MDSGCIWLYLVVFCEHTSNTDNQSTNLIFYTPEKQLLIFSIMVLWGILLTGFSVVCMVPYRVYCLPNNFFLPRKAQLTSPVSLSLSNQYQTHVTRMIFFGMRERPHQWIRNTRPRKARSTSVCYLASETKILCQTCNFRRRSNISDLWYFKMLFFQLTDLCAEK